MKKISFSKVSANIIKETEKAYRLTVLYWRGWGDKAHEVTLWYPKSCCKVTDGKVVEIADFIIDDYRMKNPRLCINYLFNPDEVKMKKMNP